MAKVKPEFKDEMRFDIEMKDEDLVASFNLWKKESESYHDRLLRKQKQAEQYYLGEQTERDRRPAYLSDTVENRIFEAVETMVPIITASAHRFMVLPGTERPESKAKALSLQKVLSRKYETLFIQQKLEQAIREMLLYRFGVLRWEWDAHTDDIGVRGVDPRLIFVPKLRLDPHELPIVMELQEYTRDDLEDAFPDVDPLDVSTTKVDVGMRHEEQPQTKIYRVFEVWTDEMVSWISGEKVLQKMANPYYDFKGSEVKDYDEISNKRKTTLKFRNHLDRPEKPFVFLTDFKAGDEPFGSVSLVEIGISIQDSINAQKRSIIDNLKRLGNARLLVDSNAMTQEEAEQITDEPGGMIFGNGVASEGKVRTEPGVPLPNSHFANLQHSEAVFDNIMGVHSATRGSAGAKTLGQDILSRQQDFTRIDLLARTANRAMHRLSNGLVQLMRMFYDRQHVVKILGAKGAAEFVKFSRDDIEDYIEIIVKDGMDVTIDRASMRSEAIQLWQLQALDPETLFERLGFPNPALAAEKLLAYRQGQLTMETQARIAEQRAGVQAKAGASAVGGTTEKRGVETPNNVIQRARQSLGGTAPSPAGVSNANK